MLEENKNIGEQPEALDIQAVATEGNLGSTEGEGSPLGKFKNSEALLDAYNVLQSEFTRKCQKLSETEKKLQEVSSLETGNKENENLKNEFAWQNKISEFLQSHKNANGLAEEITTELMRDAELRESDDGLEKAYNRVIINKYIPQEELAMNDEFLEKFIYSNEKVKDKIIKEYVASLQVPKSPLNLNRVGMSGGVATGTQNFTSLAEANKFVEHMFKF